LRPFKTRDEIPVAEKNGRTATARSAAPLRYARRFFCDGESRLIVPEKFFAFKERKKRKEKVGKDRTPF